MNDPIKAQFNLATYNGSYAYEVSNQVGDSTDEYGDPRVDVWVTQRHPDHSMIDIDLGSEDVGEHPSVTIERQTDRWCIVIAGRCTEEPELIVSILDDGRIVSQPGGICVDNVTFLKGNDPLPTNLPPDQCRFGLPKSLQPNPQPQEPA